MIIARIQNGIVVNFEEADMDWYEANKDASADLLVIFDQNPTLMPSIGSAYDSKTGFAEPAAAQPVQLTQEEVDAAIAEAEAVVAG